MEDALTQLKILQKNEFNKVSFNYLDMIRWLESKIKNKPLVLIINSKSDLTR